MPILRHEQTSLGLNARFIQYGAERSLLCTRAPRSACQCRRDEADEGVLKNPAWKGAVIANNVASRAIKRDAAPEDLTGTLIYLASADSDFVTGQLVVVDGGSVMH